MARDLSKGIFASDVGKDAKDNGKGFSRGKAKGKGSRFAAKEKTKETDVAYIENQHE